MNSIVEAGGKACPPLIVGIGIGGNFESVARLAKRAVFRPIGVHNPDPKLRDIETELLIDMNKLGIGAMGLGGDVTALAVNIEYADTHISCLPVAINTQCWRGERATGRVFTDGRIEYDASNKLWERCRLNYELTTPLTEDVVKKLKVGDVVSISGIVFGIRDATHRKMMDEGVPLPVSLENQVVFHTAPSVKEVNGEYEVVSGQDLPPARG